MLQEKAGKVPKDVLKNMFYLEALLIRSERRPVSAARRKKNGWVKARFPFSR